MSHPHSQVGTKAADTDGNGSAPVEATIVAETDAAPSASGNGVAAGNGTAPTNGNGAAATDESAK